MSDWQTLKARVAGEMKRGELTASATAVENAVLDAIKYWEKKRFPWNEMRDSSIVTTTDDPFTSSVPSNILYEDAIRVTVSGREYPLTKQTYDWIDHVDSGQWSSYPDYYAWYQAGSGTATAQYQTLRLYPVPNGVYTLTFSFIRTIPGLSAGASADASNAWTTDGEPLIRHWAKAYLFEHQLRAPQHAQQMYRAAEQEYRNIRGWIRRRVGSGRIRATHF